MPKIPLSYVLSPPAGAGHTRTRITPVNTHGPTAATSPINVEAGNMEQLPADSSVERAEIPARPIDAQAQARNTVANGLSTDAEEEERARERANKREIFFVREGVLRHLNRIPRRGSDQTFATPSPACQMTTCTSHWKSLTVARRASSSSRTCGCGRVSAQALIPTTWTTKCAS